MRVSMRAPRWGSDHDPLEDASEEGAAVSNDKNIRFATVAGTREQIAPYLPTNYKVVGSDGERTVIAGVDNAGWTLDDYVLPRLASGLYFGHELAHPPQWLVSVAFPTGEVADRTEELAAADALDRIAAMLRSEDEPDLTDIARVVADTGRAIVGWRTSDRGGS